MKKASIGLVVITIVFSAFTGGFFLGRNYNHSEVNVSTVQAAGRAATPTEAAADVAPASVDIVNINTATVEELSTLPGIGTVLAQRIIDYRQEHGPFSDIAELAKVSGIGEKRLEAILDYITVGG